MAESVSSTPVTDARKLTKIGAYNVGKTIGKGNFAVVKLAEHFSAKEKVAIKMIDKSALSEENLKKTLREIHLMKLINHTNIIRLYEVMETERYLYLVLEYAENGEIFDLLIKNGRLPESEARKMFRQIISAVEFLHQKRIVHRDLKAENLLLDENHRIKLADFGFSNMFPVGAKLKTWCGSPPYAAPELFEGKEYYGPAADIWSMGVVLYVLVCGALPFDGKTLPDLKQRVLAGKFRIPFFMSSDCESLIRHMLVVDLNKRYTMNQIKQHKWIIQGEPYEFLEEEDEFQFAQQHNCDQEKDDTPLILNETIVDQMLQMGEDNGEIYESIEKKKFDHIFGLYHILLDKHLKNSRLMAMQSRKTLYLETLSLNPEVSPTHEISQPYNFSNTKQSDFEEGDPDPKELAKYLSSRRRETIAVSHMPPDIGNPEFFVNADQNKNIPDISICRSPSPQQMSDTFQLQYKEKYLPRPAVLQVRSQFDRRASDGAATLQESILQFNQMYNKKIPQKQVTTPYSQKETENSNSNLLSVPVDSENTGSESENEVDKEAVENYLRGRGKRQRHTINSGSLNRSNLTPTLEECEGDIDSLKEFHQQFFSKHARTTNKIANRDRERASPIPYIPITPESRRLVSERRQSDSLFSDKKKDEGNDSFIKSLAEHKMLQEQFAGSSFEARPSLGRVRPIFPFPNYAENTLERPALESNDVDHGLLLLQQKQEAQRQNIYNEFLVKKKFLEKKLEEERNEFIRRASEGTPSLGESIAEFLEKKKAKIKTPPPPDQFQTNELQDEMQKLNLQVKSGVPLVGKSSPFNETMFSEPPNPANYSQFALNDPLRSMEVEQLSISQPTFQFGMPQHLFDSPSMNNNLHNHISHSSSNTNPMINTPQRPYFPSQANHGLLGEMIWGAENSENKEFSHQKLASTSSTDITTTLNLAEAVKRIEEYLNNRDDVEYNQSDSYFSLYKQGIQMEIEVYPLSKNSVVNGIKLHRVGGDKWAYRKLRDEIHYGLYLD